MNEDMMLTLSDDEGNEIELEFIDVVVYRNEEYAIFFPKDDDGTIILPLADVSFGVGAGAFAGNAKNNAGGGMGGKISPSSVLVLKDGHAKLVNVKNQDVVTKVIDLVPDVLDRFTKGKKEKEELDKKVNEVVDGMEED